MVIITRKIKEIIEKRNRLEENLKLDYLPEENKSVLRQKIHLIDWVLGDE